jgi:hypothetical protein
MPPPESAWHGHQSTGLHPTMNLPGPPHGHQQGQEQARQGQQDSGLHPFITPPGPQGQQGQSLFPGPPGESHTPMTGPHGQQGQPYASGTPGGGQNIPNASAAPQAPAAQQGGAQITGLNPTGNNGGGAPKAVTGRGPQAQTSYKYSGIRMALERLAPLMTDADTSRNLRWQQDAAGDPTKLSVWKIEATSSLLASSSMHICNLGKHSWWSDT